MEPPKYTVGQQLDTEEFGTVFVVGIYKVIQSSAAIQWPCEYAYKLFISDTEFHLLAEDEITLI